MFFNKGAMFGLDARIALAIFGALSVISGAALYNAIQDSKVTAILAELREVEKSIEAYYLDTGKLVSPFDARDLKILELIENSENVQGWNGPYTSLSQYSTENKLNPAFGVRMSLTYRDKASGSTTCTKSMDYCYIYIWYNVDSDDVMSLLDLKVDGAVDASTGVIQYSPGAFLYKTNIIYDSSNALTS